MKKQPAVKFLSHDAAIEAAEEAVERAKKRLARAEKRLALVIQNKKDHCTHERTKTSEGCPGGMGIYYQHKWCEGCDYRWPSFSDSQRIHMGQVYRNTHGEMLFKPGTADVNITSGN